VQTSIYDYVYIYIYIYLSKATPEEREEASEALTKYDALTEDVQRRRFSNNGQPTCMHIIIY